MQGRFSINSTKRYQCDFENCDKSFPNPSKLKRHKNTHELNASSSSSVPSVVFHNPMTPANAAVNTEQSTAATQQSPTAETVRFNLERMVFYEDDELEGKDFSDEEEDEEPEDPNAEFTEPSAIEPEEEEAVEVEDQTPIVVNGEFFPFRNKMHQLMHQFYYRSGSDVSQGLMKDIVKLVTDVVKAKEEYPECKVPAADLIFNFDDPRRTKNQVPVFKQTTHEVEVVRKDTDGQQVQTTRSFTMNPPSEILRYLVANPTIVDRLTRLPDFTEGEMVDSYQTDKWCTHCDFQHPMVTTELNGAVKDIWVGDLLKGESVLMIAERFFTLNHQDVMVEGYEVVQVDGKFVLQNMPEKTVMKITQIRSVLCDEPQRLSLELEPSVANDPSLHRLCSAVLNKLKTPHPLKRLSPLPSRKFMPVMVIPLNLFTDDMSGNRTKKHNKFDSWIMVPAALPLSERHALENTAFICTDHFLSAMQMLPSLVNDLVMLENGVGMFLSTGEPVVVTAPVQFITADNARHSELASTRGAISKQPCRKCTWHLKAAPREDGQDYECESRSESVVAAMYNTYLATGDKKELVNVDTGYKLVGGQALLSLRSFDTMLDCPIELLHTIMLGVGKSLVKCLLHESDFLLPAEKSVLETKLFGYESNGFSRKLRSSLRLHGSFLGRDFKILMQQIPIVLSQLISSGEIVPRSDGLTLICKCFNDLGKLVSLSYTSRIEFNKNLYQSAIASTYDDLRRSILVHDKHLKARFPTRKGVINIYNSSKFHILYHLVFYTFRFGSPILYETEKGEQFNKFIRECLFRTNRQNPSRDVAVAFSKRFITRHVLTGGSWQVAGQTVRCSAKVLESASSFDCSIRNFADNDSNNLKVKVGSTGVFRNKYGNLLIGEVSKVDVVNNSFTVVEYALWRDRGRFTRFKDNKHGDIRTSVYHTCIKDSSGNLVVTKLSATSVIKENEGQFVEMLDLSRKLTDEHNLINISKFGTFWWTLSHEIHIIN